MHNEIADKRDILKSGEPQATFPITVVRASGFEYQRICGALESENIPYSTKTVKKKLNEFGIEVKLLEVTKDSNAEINERLMNGYKYLFRAKRKMSYQKFQQFFQIHDLEGVHIFF